MFVHDLTAPTATSTSSPPTRHGGARVIETYTGRWNIETTFQEIRSYLGVETTRGWSRETVLAGGAVPVRAVLGGGVLYAAPPAEATARGW